MSQSEEVKSKSNDLKKRVTLWNGMSIIVGTMIGVGIFISPGTILKSLPGVTYSLLMWLLCGLIAIGASLTYVELGLMFPESGGEYVYMYEGLHRFIAFSYIWCSIFVIKPTSIAILIQFFAETVIKLFFMDCQSFPQISTRCLASAIVLILFLLNTYRFKWSLKTNNLLTCCKFLALGTMIILGFVHLCRGITDNLHAVPASTAISLSSLGSSFYNGMWSFDGWNQLNYMSGEMQKPSRDLPLALIISTSLITIVYVLVNFSYIVLLGINAILVSDGVAYDASSVYFGRFSFIVSIFVALSAFSAGNATLFCGGRIFYEAAKNKQLPWLLCALHRKHRTMITSLFVQAIITVGYLLLVGDIEMYLVYFSGAVWFFYLMTFSALILLRFTKPNHPRPFRIHISIPIVMCGVALIINIFGFVEYWKESLISVAGILSAGIPYFLFVRNGSILPDSFNRAFDSISNKIAVYGDLYFPASDSEIEG